LAWNYLKGHGDINAPKSNLMYASLQLYLATGDSAYHDLFQAAAQSIVAVEGTWPEQYLPGNTEAKCQTAYFVSYLLATERETNHDLADKLKSKVLRFAEEGTYMGPAPESFPYPQGVTKFLGWGSGTAQGRYADVWMYASLFAPDALTKQRYFNAVCQYGDYSLGLNPMGMSYYTGLGTDQPTAPLDCNSYYTKYGLSDGVTPDTHRDSGGKPIGNVPGTLVYGPSEGRSGQFYESAVSNKMFPAYEEQPQQRRYAQGWSLIYCNEFTTHETMVWNVVMHGFLYDASADSSRPFKLLAQTAANHEIELRWEAVVGQRYQIESNSTLNPAEWTNVDDAMEATSSTMQWSQSAKEFQGYFRVKRL
jgi:endoglucanase